MITRIPHRGIGGVRTSIRGKDGGWILWSGQGLGCANERNKRYGFQSRLRVVGCDLLHLNLRRSDPGCGGANRRETMTEKPSKQIPRWLTIDVLIILVGLVIITGGIWITNARIFGVPIYGCAVDSLSLDAGTH